MIRPITVICWILALGAGLYLYRAKHEVELMDKHIEQIAKQTSDLRAESRHFLDEWIRLGEPEQLRKYSDQYLGLKSILPTQFVRMSDLPARLPAPRADPPDEPADAVAQGAPPDASQTADAAADQPVEADEASAGDLPVPPIPPEVSPITQVAFPSGVTPLLQARPVTPRPAAAQPEPPLHPRVAPETRTAEEPRPMPKPAPLTVAEPRPAPAAQPPRQDLPPLQAQRLPPLLTPGAPPPQGAAQAAAPQGLPPLQAQRPAAPRAVETPVAENRFYPARPNAEPRPYTAPVQTPYAETRGQPARPAAAAPIQQPGSLLGMTHGPVPLPLPAPTPVSATWTGPSR